MSLEHIRSTGTELNEVAIQNALKDMFRLKVRARTAATLDELIRNRVIARL